jgi:hypothetical protein
MSTPEKPDNLTKTSIGQFFTFVKFLATNNLIDKAEAHLKSKALNDIWISVDPIHEVQKMIQAELSKGGKLTPDAKAIILSGHGNTYC